MKNIYIGSDSNSPSRTIFFKFQLPFITKTEKFSIVSNIYDADLVIIPNSKIEIKKILKINNYNFLLKNQIPLFIIKPHFERDIRLSFKNFYGMLKSIFNRFRIVDSIYQIPEKLKKTNVTLICDNRRIVRFFKSQGWDTFYLPLTYFENARLQSLKEIKLIKNPEIIYMGEISHFLEWVNDIKFLLNQKEFANFKIRLFVFGSFSKKAIDSFIGKDKLIWDKFEFNHRTMIAKTKNAIFGLVPHKKSIAFYKPNIVNILNIFSSQPNEVKTYEKFSSNSGRNHLMASLGIPFITSPSENVLVEFSDYPFELFIENKDELYFAGKSLIDEDLRQEISRNLINVYNKKFSPKYGMIKLENYLISKING